jgi:hypothetical protein
MAAAKRTSARPAAAKRDMPEFSKKSPPDLVERFGAVLERYPQAQRRQMFGYPAAFVGGNMATSLFQDRWVVRLADADREELQKLEGSGPFEPMPGRPMKGFAVVPPSFVADDAKLGQWVERALAFAASLPPKK